MGSRRPARRALLARAIALLGLPAVGCSLIIPLDYTGGTLAAGAGNAGFAGYVPPAVGGTSGQGGSGGSGLSGGSGGQGGQGGSVAGGASGGKAGTGDEGPGGEAGTGATGGSQGGAAPMGGEGGDAGMAGAEGGMAGAEGGMGGSGGTGACPGVDLETDPAHCGSCTHACLPKADCIGGMCINSPCQGLCTPAVEVPLTGGDGYRVDDIGSAATCHQVAAYDPAPNLPSIIAWNFDTGRTLKVNGVAVVVMTEPGAPLDMPTRAGGYCIQASAGNFDWAGYKLPLPSPLTP